MEHSLQLFYCEAGVLLAFSSVNLITQCSMFAQWNANITTMNGMMAAASDSNHHSRHPDFSSDQAAALRDIARNGSGDDGSLYGFHEMGSSGHANGRVARVGPRIYKYSLPIRAFTRLPEPR